MDVQFAAPRLEVDIAEWLQPLDLVFRELHEHTAIASEPLQVRVALPIQIGAHLLHLKIGHVAHTPAQRALMRPRTAELKPLHQPPMRK